MIDPKLAIRYFRTHGMHVAMTFGLLLVAFIENYYINCMDCGTAIGCIGGGGSQFWCGFGWIYLILGFILLSVAHYYRRLATKRPKGSNNKSS
jgi:hypothetical protein